MNYYSYHIFTIITNVFRYFATYFPFQGLLVNEQKCLYRGGRKRKRRGDRDTILLLPRIQVFYSKRWIKNQERNGKGTISTKKGGGGDAFALRLSSRLYSRWDIPNTERHCRFFFSPCALDDCSLKLKLLIFKQDKELTPNKMRCQLVVS